MPENSTPKRKHAGNRVDPRSPYVFDLREQGRSPGTLTAFRRRVPAPAGLALDLASVAEGEALDLDVKLESVTEGVLVTGTVTAGFVGECGRCLDPVRDEVVGEFTELFAYGDSTTDETTDADEVHRVEDDYLDLEPVLHDAVVLALPFTPLCRSDCSGLCPDCGQRLDDLPDGHTHDKIDPRFAGLKGLLDPKE